MQRLALAMISLSIHAVVGLTIIGFIVASNRTIFTRPAAGPQVSALECVYYGVGIASVGIGWYFNIRFVREFSAGSSNPIWGPGSWADYIRLMFVNPAAASASQDYTIANVVLFPLWTMIDGRRRGVRHPWTFFAGSLLTSFAFAFAFYLATVERQRRHLRSRPAPVAANS